MEKFPKIYNSFSKIDKNSSKINKNFLKINRICQKLTKIRQNQRKFVENHLKFGTKIWHCHPSSPKNFPVLCRFFKISSSKKRHKSGTRLYITGEDNVWADMFSRPFGLKKPAHTDVHVPAGKFVDFENGLRAYVPSWCMRSQVRPPVGTKDAKGIGKSACPHLREEAGSQSTRVTSKHTGDCQAPTASRPDQCEIVVG